MTFKQGNFYDSAGNKIPVEFGNIEQIQIIQAIEAMKTEGRVYVGQSHKCFCGELHLKGFVDGKTFKCECGAVYKFMYYQEEIPVLKML